MHLHFINEEQIDRKKNLFIAEYFLNNTNRHKVVLLNF
jgi:hypothetical protein